MDNSKYIDFKCDCGSYQCGKLRVLKIETENGDIIVDFGFIKPRAKTPKAGVILSKNDLKELKKLLSNK